MEWSNGVIFLMATFWPDGLCSAELDNVSNILRFLALVLPDNTISSLSNHILNVILIRHIERDLPRPSMGGILTLSHGGSV